MAAAQYAVEDKDVDGTNEEEETEEFTNDASLKKSKQLAWKACCNLLCFLSFLIVFTLVQLIGQTGETSLFAEHLRSKYGKDLHNVTDEASFYKYIEEVFLPTTYFYERDIEPIQPDTSLIGIDIEIERWFLGSPEKGSYPDPNLHEVTNAAGSILPALDMANRVLGAVKVRQHRVVLLEDCIQNNMFTHFTTSCYPNYSRLYTQSYLDQRIAEAEKKEQEKLEAAGESAPPEEEKSDDEEEVEREKKLLLLGDLEPTTQYRGSFALYDGESYSKIFSNLADSTVELDRMRNQGYLDRGTRCILLDFTVYNSNIAQFGVVRMSFEFAPSGAVKPSMRVLIVIQRFLKMFLFATAQDIIACIFDIYIAICLIFYVIEEVSELSITRWSYLKDFWNILDWINMILLLLAFAYRFQIVITANALGEIGAKELMDNTEYTDFQEIAENISTARVLNSFNSVLLWMKFIKYIEFMPYVQFLYLTVKEAFGIYGSFLFMFWVMLLAFCHAFTIAFGEFVENMRSFEVAVITLARSFLGDVDFLPIYAVAPEFGAFLIMAFYVVIMMVGLNVFFAILASAISDNKANISELKKDIRHLALYDAAGQIKLKIKMTAAKILSFVPFLYKWAYKTKTAPEGADDAIEDIGKSPSYRKRKGDDASSVGSHIHSSRSHKNEIRVYEKGTYRSKEITDFSPQEIAVAADQMAGRVLTRLETAGIEVKIESLRLKDAITEMLNVSKILATRTEQISLEQDAYINKSNGR